MSQVQWHQHWAAGEEVAGALPPMPLRMASPPVIEAVAEVWLEGQLAEPRGQVASSLAPEAAAAVWPVEQLARPPEWGALLPLRLADSQPAATLLAEVLLARWLAT